MRLASAYCFLRWRDVAFVGVLVWALIGIAVNHSDIILVAWTAAGLAGILVVLAVSTLVKGRKTVNRKNSILRD